MSLTLLFISAPIQMTLLIQSSLNSHAFNRSCPGWTDATEYVWFLWCTHVTPIATRYVPVPLFSCSNLNKFKLLMAGNIEQSKTCFTTTIF